MAKSVEEIMAYAMELTPRDQDLLAWKLCTAKSGSPDQGELDSLWLEEAQCRLREIENGAVEALDGKHVFEELRRHLNDAL